MARNQDDLILVFTLVLQAGLLAAYSYSWFYIALTEVWQPKFMPGTMSKLEV